MKTLFLVMVLSTLLPCRCMLLGGGKFTNDKNTTTQVAKTTTSTPVNSK